MYNLALDSLCIANIALHHFGVYHMVVIKCNNHIKAGKTLLSYHLSHKIDLSLKQEYCEYFQNAHAQQLNIHP